LLFTNPISSRNWVSFLQQMFGAVEISFEEYTKQLHKAYVRECKF